MDQAIDHERVGRANTLRQLLHSMELMRQSLQAELDALEWPPLKRAPMSPEEFRRLYVGSFDLGEDPETKRERIRQNVRARLERGEVYPGQSTLEQLADMAGKPL